MLPWNVQAEEKPSKTERKRAMHELQALGERLVGLNPEQLAAIALPEDLHDAVEQARGITKHEARRRQMQYIGRLMRAVDPEPIREKLKVWDGISTEETARVHRIERWREELIEDDGAIGALVHAHPGIDTQRLRALVRNARAERNAGRPPRAFRELFRALRDIIPDSQPVPDDDGE
jgi:ribosome-associated protein